MAENIFRTCRDFVTARQAGEKYGLRFERNGRAYCPWHDDGKHPALGFFDGDRMCHCFACGVTADCVDLTARLLGCTKSDAARRLASDFGFSLDLKSQDDRKCQTPTPQEREQRKRFLLQIVESGNRKLKAFPEGRERDRIVDSVSAAMRELSTYKR